jgi:hypothetical protein
MAVDDVGNGPPFSKARWGVPSMFDSLEVKVLCPRSGGDEG